MAAYGALVSLMHIIDALDKNPSPPISIDKKQAQSLAQNVTFLQEFLDCYISPVSDSHGADPLERRIADAVYAVEDVIESQIVVQIDRRSTIREDIIESQNVVQNDRRPTMRGKMINFINLFRGVCKCASAGATASSSLTSTACSSSSAIAGASGTATTTATACSSAITRASGTATIEEDFYHDLQQAIEKMNMIKKEAMETAAVAQLQRKVSSTHAAGSLTSSCTVKENVMVGFDEVFLEVLDKLTGDQLNRQIIPIMGMGGIGKTTLARNLFENALVKEHFDIRAWTTISQTYNVRETLRQVLSQASGGSSIDLSENELGEKLHKFLYGRRYIVIMDDMWSVEVWEKIKFFFPDNQNGSRIVVTTRLSNLSSQLNESYRVGMKFLDEASSWGLFCKTVFGKESCPLELENNGKNIVANCKGLPLSIATIGGLLAKSERTREYWEHIEENLNSIVINSNDEFCLKILRMSYIYLPNYLKPCFLYMGVFGEDSRIRVSMLEKLWVCEGFLKPRRGKCLETIAQEYFKELVDRHLILVDELGFSGNVKYCKIHDLMRDLCLKEVENERFYHVIRRHDPPTNNSERRVVLRTQELLKSEVMGSFSHARSIICDVDNEGLDGEVLLPHNLRLLRTFKANEYHFSYWNPGVYFLDNVFELVNSRYLGVSIHEESKFPTSIDLLWNLHTLIIECRTYLIAPIEIWKLHQLRHLVFIRGEVILPDPPSGENEIVIMENVQTLKGVKNLYLNEEVVKRIPNVKKLYLTYDEVKQMQGANSLNYLQCLNKLENFRCEIEYKCDEYWQWIRFPHSLKKLYVGATFKMELEDIMPKIGSLPLLEKFVLRNGVFKTGKWETIEGQFQCLKLLQLDSCWGLEDWVVSDNSHFPLLQELRLYNLFQLKEIPSEVGEIATLKLIYLLWCSESVVVSAKKIVEEQEDLYGDQLDLHVRVEVLKKEEALKSLASPNFEVIVG